MDYILESPAKCPNCRREILQKTLVEPSVKVLRKALTVHG